MRDYFHSKMLHLKGEIKNREKASIPLRIQRFYIFMVNNSGWRLKRYQMRDYFHSKMLHLKGEIKNREKASIPLRIQRFYIFMVNNSGLIIKLITIKKSGFFI